MYTCTPLTNTTTYTCTPLTNTTMCTCTPLTNTTTYTCTPLTNTTTYTCTPLTNTTMYTCTPLTNTNTYTCTPLTKQLKRKVGRSSSEGSNVRLSIGRTGVRVHVLPLQNLRQFHSPHFVLVSFRRDTKSQSLLSGVYTRGTKRSHAGGKYVTCCGLTDSNLKIGWALHKHVLKVLHLSRQQKRVSVKKLAQNNGECLSCLSGETLKAGPFYLVSIPGELKDPTQGVNM